MPQHSSQRRRLLQALAALLPTAALAQDKRVNESDPQAQTLGYHHDATQVDKSKFKTYEPGHTCSGCRFFKGAAGQAWGPCDIFAGKQVNAGGWCSAWVKKV